MREGVQFLALNQEHLFIWPVSCECLLCASNQSYLVKATGNSLAPDILNTKTQTNMHMDTSVCYNEPVAELLILDTGSLKYTSRNLSSNLQATGNGRQQNMYFYSYAINIKKLSLCDKQEAKQYSEHVSSIL